VKSSEAIILDFYNHVEAYTTNSKNPDLQSGNKEEDADHSGT
jgi:hypothetical protein